MQIVFNMKMFDSESRIVVERGNGYDSIMKHSHEFVEVVYVESGEGLQITDSGQIRIKKGDIFLMSGNESHSIRPLCDESEFKLVNVIFMEDVVDMDLSIFRSDRMISLSDEEEAVALIYKIEAEYNARREYFEYFNRGYLYQLLGILARKLNKDGRSGRDITIFKNKEYVRLAVAYIREHYAERISLSDIARHVGLSNGYLQKIFNKESETSVVKYLLNYRIEQACKLLIESDYSIAQISNMVGFSDVKNFYVTFKSVMNETPGMYHKKHRTDKKETQVDRNS